VARGKKKPAEKKTAKNRKSKRETRKSSAIVRVLTNPETGEEVRLQAYDQYPDAFKYMAKVMFISGTSRPADISNKLGIPENTVRTWVTREGWVPMKREVQRLASRDAVQIARTAMSNYLRDMDRGLNGIMNFLNERHAELKDEKKITDEGTIFKYMLEVWKVKLAIVRTLTYGVQGKAFTPHPSNLMFDGTEPAKLVPSLTSNSAEEILDGIPPYLKEAANFVLGMDLDNMDPAVLDAVAAQIDELKGLPEDDEDDNVML
jgi:hypothetical protein